MERLEQILYFKLFEVGTQTITPLRLVLLAFTLLVTALVARSVRQLFEKRLLQQVDSGPRYTIARIAQYLVWVVGVMIALEVVSIDLTALAVVAGALGVGIGFGLQNIASNFVAGLVLLFERPIKVGDRVTVENIEGDVVEINFRSTTIRTNDNIAIIVPNSDFINRTVINWSHGDNRVRIRIPVGVAYGSDVGLVTETLLRVAAETEGALRIPEPSVNFTQFGNSSLDFELLVWTDRPAVHPRLRSRLNYGIDAAFRRQGIEIPFPQRDIHVRSATGLERVIAAPPK